MHWVWLSFTIANMYGMFTLYFLTFVYFPFFPLQARVYENSIHSINITLVNASREDNNYPLICTATNIVGMVSAPVQLTVHCKFGHKAHTNTHSQGSLSLQGITLEATIILYIFCASETFIICVAFTVISSDVWGKHFNSGLKAGPHHFIVFLFLQS